MDAAPSQTQMIASPRAVVRSFYRFHFSHDHNFIESNLYRRRKWLTPTLFQLLTNEFRRDEEYARAHPNESYVPYMEGDPFTNASEFPTSFRFGQTSVSGDRATVKVLLLWNARSSRGTDQRNLEVRLVKVRGNWRIDDIVDTDHNDDLVTVLKREKYFP
ncbi:MAG TPA: DUF3828 domain-containing protein [Pyrinomonadaceae bacterium]|nr:DUF3828 domain-containing protein [Pyrinomonadaceae bacterium]